jgi:ATP-dependent DNA helicase RecG
MKTTDRTNRDWDSEPSKLWWADINLVTFEAYTDKAGLTWETPNAAFAELGLIKDKKLVNAAGLFFDRLFFGRNPACLFQAETYEGTDTATLLDQQSFKGNILEAIEVAQRTITQNIGKCVEGGDRVDRPEIATEAIREAIINAFCHRDYSDTAPVQIAIYQDRVEIRNPGTLIEGVRLKDLAKGNVSRTRNPLIADLLQRIKLVASKGQGIPLILENEPETTFEAQPGMFVTKLKRTIT